MTLITDELSAARWAKCLAELEELHFLYAGIRSKHICVFLRSSGDPEPKLLLSLLMKVY